MLKRFLTSKLSTLRLADWRSASLLFISLIAIYGASVYFIYALTWPTIIFVLAISLITCHFIAPRLPIGQIKAEPSSQKEARRNYFKYWPLALYLFLWLISLLILKQSETDKSIISPWQVVPAKFFVSYIFASLALIFILTRQRFRHGLKMLGLSAHYFLSLGVALIVYKIAYGFDPFIHQATMELIADQGAVEPKPFYYLGEYSLVVIAHKLSGISVYLLNKFLVPLLAAIFLPWGIIRLTRSQSQTLLSSHKKAPMYLSALLALGIGFSPFIISTPQSLSYLFLILALALGLSGRRLLWPFILSLAALAIHPLTGLPALGWLGFLTLQKYEERIKKVYVKFLRTFLFIANALILPSALFISGANNLKEATFNFASLLSPLKALWEKFSLAGTENIWLNTSYFLAANYPLWIILLIIAGWLIYRRNKQKKIYSSLLLSSGSLIFAYLLAGLINFNDVISYEQDGFASRLLILIIIFSLPFIILALNRFLILIKNRGRLERIIWLSAGLVWLSASLYFSYPRFDNYFNSRGYSTGANDIKAVQLIASEAEKPYIVLANQQVSAAALKEFGFDNYHSGPDGKIFFYPIPTGGPLYQYYLDMVYKNPSRETMAKARDLAGVEESYLVVNKYWHQSAQVIAEAKISADDWQTVADEVYIFKYLSDR